MSLISHNLNQLRQQIQELADLNNLTSPPQLIAVSKNFPPASIREAFAAGQRKFAENYVQEFSFKARELADLNLEWHFIGKIQSNKTKAIAEYASWVHSLSKLSHALRLQQQRPGNLAPLNVLIEVKINTDLNKQGLASFDEILNLATAINKLSNLKLCGLMGMASNSNDTQLVETQFRQLSLYLAELNQHGFKLDQLSMGMSNDFPQAISCGASLLRIGSKIFGERNYNVSN